MQDKALTKPPQTYDIVCYPRRKQPHQVSDKVWSAYRAETTRQFAQRLRRLKEWAEIKLDPSMTP